jgi:hypothetical protein
VVFFLAYANLNGPGDQHLFSNPFTPRTPADVGFIKLAWINREADEGLNSAIIDTRAKLTIALGSKV